MDSINKKALSERDICTKYITPAICQAGWDLHAQMREEVTFTRGRVIVKGRLASGDDFVQVWFEVSDGRRGRATAKTFREGREGSGFQRPGRAWRRYNN